jgi:type IV pilus assembly protein PilE
MTLIELLVVLVIMTLLSAVAAPMLTNQLREARRVDAISQLLLLQMAQEEYRLKSTEYAQLADLGTLVRSEFYTFSSTNIGAESYTLTATAQGSQTADKDCASISVNQHDQRSPAACW